MELWWGDWYIPTTAQLPIHIEPFRVKQIAGGERGGKSFTAAAYVLPRIPDSRLIWLIAKDYRQTRAEFEYILTRLLELDMVDHYSLPSSEYQPTVLYTRTGCEIRSLTSADERKIGMMAPDGIIVCEAAQISLSLYKRLRARTAEKRGWLLLEGTFERSQFWYADMWREWRGGTLAGEKSYSLPSWSNTHIFPGGWDDPEMVALRNQYPSIEEFMERHGGVPAPPTTAVFPEFRGDIHVGHYPYNPQLPVELAIDPGYAGAYAVLAVQWDSANVYVVDEVYARRRPARWVIRECKTRPWWRAINPRQAGVIDIAAKQHQAAESQLEIWASKPDRGGAGMAFRARFVPIEAGIERYRSFLVNPDDIDGGSRIYYNAETTKNSQREHILYKYNEDSAGRGQREKPIDRDNHSLKAIAYWLVDHYGFADKTRKRISYRKVRVGDYDARDRAWKPDYPGEGANWREKEGRQHMPQRRRRTRARLVSSVRLI